MKRTPSPSKRRRTASTTSTVGPHVRLSQKRGVANATTNGAPASTDSATDHR
jgi:hypothetical protein